MTTQDEIYKKIQSYRKTIFNFDREENDFKLIQYPPKEDGLYITIRCGLTGIYQTLDQYKDGVWQLRVLDGSVPIAYSRKQVVL
jgi:hypothetical protein